MLDTVELMWISVKRVGTRGIRPPAGAVENMRQLGLRPVAPSSVGRPLLAVSGASWGPARWSSRVPWTVCGRLPLREHRGPGLVRASVHLSQVLVEAGVTPAVHLHGPAPLASPHHHPYNARPARSQRTRCNRGCGACVVGCQGALGAAVQRRPRK